MRLYVWVLEDSNHLGYFEVISHVKERTGMSNKALRTILCLISFLSMVCHSRNHSLVSAVTYDFSGGRLGDCLLSYAHAKWIAYSYDMPLLYKAFPYSDQLLMHEREIHYSDELAAHFSKVVTITPDTMHTINPESGFLYIIPFFPESIFNRNDSIFPYLFSVDWHNKEFKSELQRMIAPLRPLREIAMPRDMLTVALHVRKGTGWDIPNYRITPEALTASHPLRFAPDSFYIKQLQRIAALYPDKNIYVYLFTDHNDPGALAQQYEQAVGCDRMRIEYRTDENNEFINVLDDFFALTHFDCLIRADSNFSLMASKIAEFKIVIAPWHGVVDNMVTTIDEVAIEMNETILVVKD